MDWFDRAATETKFYHEIVSKCSEIIHPASKVFDLGCGAGFLSMALAPVAKSVTAVDISPVAINFLEQRCKEKNIFNLTCQVANWHQWEPEQPANVAFICYCNGLLTRLGKISKLVKDYVVAVFPFYPNNFHLEEFYPLPANKENQETIPKAKVYLEKQHIPFQLISLCCDFGQPFVSMNEYREFLNFYFKIPQESIPAEYTKKYLHQNHQGYYLSNFKESGIMIIKKTDLRAWELMEGKQAPDINEVKDGSNGGN